MDRFCVDVCQRVGYLVSIFFELCFPNLFNPTWDDDLHLSGMGLTQPRGSTTQVLLVHEPMAGCIPIHAWPCGLPGLPGEPGFNMHRRYGRMAISIGNMLL